MSITIGKVTTGHLQSEHNLEELIYEYHCEASRVGLNPLTKISTYTKLEELDLLHVFAAYLDSTKLIGFLLMLVSELPHYSIPVSTVESYFVSKEYRHTGAGTKLREAAEFYARYLNSPGILISAPTGSDLDLVLSGTKDYKETNKIFFKRFTHE